MFRANSSLSHRLSGFTVLLLASSFASAQSISDGSFEQPALAAGTYQAAAGATIFGSPWSFGGANGSRGIAANASAFTAQTGPAPSGNQVAFIQGDGTLSQTVFFAAAGNFQVSLKAALRKENYNLQGTKVAIEVDGVARWSGTPAGSTYATYTTPTFALAAGNHAITVRGTNNYPGYDNTVFLDAVSVSTIGNTPPTVSIMVTPSIGLTAPASVTLSATASDSDGINRVEFWGDGVLRGTDYAAPYSSIWTNLAIGTHTATAKAFDNLGVSTSATQTFTVSAPPAGNVVDGGFEQPLLAAGTYQAAAGATITGSPWSFGGANGSRGIAANGSAFTWQTGPAPSGNQVAFIQGDGTLSQTVFFAAAGNYQVSLKAALRKENYNLQGAKVAIEVDGVARWSGTPAGSTYATYTTPTFALAAGNHAITVRGTNNYPGYDNTVFVDAVSVSTVAGNIPPTVSITVTPSTGLVAPANVTLTAMASDSDGINRVEFWIDGTLLGTDATYPYSIAWNSIGAGTHTATAKAFDSLGASNSASQTLTVNAPPTISLTVTPNAGLTAPASVTLSATAGDTDGTIGRVEFWGDGVLLGTDPTAPYSWIWINIGVGTHTAMAKAFDNLGASTSTSQTLTVSAPPAGNVVDGSFEQPLLAAGTYIAASSATITGSPWTFNTGLLGSRGVAANGSAFTAQTGPAPNGNQVAFIQGDGTLSQTVFFAAAGNYQVSLKAALRKENYNLQGTKVAIEVDGIARWSGTPAGSTYATYTTPTLALAAGNHAITVRGTNNYPGYDNTVFIDAVNVAAVVNPPPIVSITVTPSTGLIAPANVTLNATASDSDGVNRVEFWGNGFLLGTDTTTPYSWAWTNLAAGTYTATAKAFDNLGASASASQAFTVSTPPAANIYYGYYFTGLQLEDVTDHTNLAFELSAFYKPSDPNFPAYLQTRIDMMRANGMKAMLEIGPYVYFVDVNGNPHYLGNVDGVRTLLTQLRLHNALDLVVAFYPVDEPDQNGVPETDIIAANAALHALCMEFPELGGCALAVIYSDHYPVGKDSYDWIGTDAGNYYLGPNPMALNPGQRLILIPGGADPWRKDPAPFVAYAQAHPEVVLIMPFLWVDFSFGGTDYLGIDKNPMCNAYRQAGFQVTGKSPLKSKYVCP